MNKKEMNNKGFSLVELIIVIAIMAILVGVLAPQFIKYVESSRQSTDIQNASELKAAIEAYVAENDPASATTITIGTDSTGANLTVGGLDATGIAAALTSVGLSQNTPCRSTGWPKDKTFGSYSCSTYKWTPGATADCTNGKDPKKTMETVFK